MKKGKNLYCHSFQNFATRQINSFKAEEIFDLEVNCPFEVAQLLKAWLALRIIGIIFSNLLQIKNEQVKLTTELKRTTMQPHVLNSDMTTSVEATPPYITSKHPA